MASCQAEPSAKNGAALSKRVRFQIFDRDGFTCQYCGGRPPDVVLEVDHIDPRANGGSNDPLNLVTSCGACNRGKSDRKLGSAPPRPDCNPIYLATLQEIEEIRRFHDAQNTLTAERVAAADNIADYWSDSTGYNFPGLETGQYGSESKALMVMIERSGPAMVRAAIAVTVRKFRAVGSTMTQKHVLSHIGSTIRRLEEESEA